MEGSKTDKFYMLQNIFTTFFDIAAQVHIGLLDLFNNVLEERK